MEIKNYSMFSKNSKSIQKCERTEFRLKIFEIENYRIYPINKQVCKFEVKRLQRDGWRMVDCCTSLPRALQLVFQELINDGLTSETNEIIGICDLQRILNNARAAISTVPNEIAFYQGFISKKHEEGKDLCIDDKGQATKEETQN